MPPPTAALAWGSGLVATLPAVGTILLPVAAGASLLPLLARLAPEQLGNPHRFPYAGEILATIAEDGFWSLRAPLRRLTAPDMQIPFSPALEKGFYPDAAQIVDAARRFGFAAACTRVEELLDDPAIHAVFITTRHGTHARMVVVPRCGHLPMLEGHQVTTDAVLRFLAGGEP